MEKLPRLQPQPLDGVEPFLGGALPPGAAIFRSQRAMVGHPQRLHPFMNLSPADSETAAGRHDRARRHDRTGKALRRPRRVVVDVAVPPRALGVGRAS